MINETVQNRLLDMVSVLGTKISEIAPELWRIMIKQQYVTGIGFLIGVIACIAGHILAIKWIKMMKDAGITVDDGEFTGILFCYMVRIGTIIAGFALLYNGIAHFINPEYYAIQSLINMVK